MDPVKEKKVLDMEKWRTEPYKSARTLTDNKKDAIELMNECKRLKHLSIIE